MEIVVEDFPESMAEICMQQDAIQTRSHSQAPGDNGPPDNHNNNGVKIIFRKSGTKGHHNDSHLQVNICVLYFVKEFNKIYSIKSQ
jgi:hypothetical protein